MEIETDIHASIHPFVEACDVVRGLSVHRNVRRRYSSKCVSVVRSLATVGFDDEAASTL